MKSSIVLATCVSSQIAGHGYDAATKTMALQFHQKGGVSVPYHYANVSPEKYAEFQAAESKGRWFGANLKNNRDEHPFTKMVDDSPDEAKSAPQGDGNGDAGAEQSAGDAGDQEQQQETAAV